MLDKENSTLRDYLRRPSFIAGIAGLVLAIIAFLLAFIPLLLHQTFSVDNGIEIALGFLVLWVTHVITVIFQQIELTQDIEKGYKQGNDALVAEGKKISEGMDKSGNAVLTTLHGWHERFMEILEFEKEFLNDVWLNQHLVSLAKLRKEVNADPIVSKAFEHSFDAFLEDTIERVQQNSFKQNYDSVSEMKRMLRLQQIIEHAKNYVYAVTLDRGPYLEDFWTGKFADDYLASNRKNPLIHRALILDQSVIANANSYKHQLIAKLLNYHLDNEIDIHIVLTNNLPASWAQHDTSFLLCDDFVVSESYSLSDGGKTPGYIALNDQQAMVRLKRLYFELKGRSSELEQIRKTLRI